MNPIRVLLVDDHQIVRQGLRAILDPDERFIVVGEAVSGAEALSLAGTEKPDVVVLDLMLADMGGAEVCQRLLAAFPDMAVLILTGYFDHSLLNACLRAGARGYLLKDAELLRLPEQLLAVVKGQAALDPRAASFLADYVRKQGMPMDTLTPREMDVLRLMGQGLTNREIAGQLVITENTVKGYVKDIFSKLRVHNRVEAVMQARARGLL